MDGILDMATFNHYYRNKLKMSLTYQICNGYFKNVRAILDTDPSYERIDVNETDEWWLDNEAFRRKSATANIGILSSLESNFPIVLPLIRNPQQLPKLTKMSPKEIAELDYRKRVGRTSLMLCSLIEDDIWALNIAQIILERPGASLTQKDSNGHNAIHYAVMYQRYSLLELFLNVIGDYGLLAQDRFGNTVFHLAGLLSKNDGICQLLHSAFLKYKNEPTDKLTKNKKGDTPIVLCHNSGHEGCMRNVYLYLNLKGIKDTPESMYYNIQKPSILNQVHFRESLEPLSDSSRSHESNNKDRASLVINEEVEVNTKTDSYIGQSTTNLTDNSNYGSNASVVNPPLLDISGSPESYGLNKRSNINLEKTYRHIFILIEPLIKHSSLYQQEKFEDTEIFKNSVNIYKKNLANYKKLVETRSYKNNQVSEYSKSKLAQVFETIEVSKTKSFRPSNLNLSSNLFEKVSSGILQGKGLFVKQKSTVSDKSTSRRQSVGSSSRATKQSHLPSQAQSRRTSVIT